MMEGGGEWLLSPPLPLSTPLWGLAQPVSQVQGRPNLQPAALGWGWAAWHMQTSRASGGSQVSSPKQVRAMSPGTALLQNPGFLMAHP